MKRNRAGNSQQHKSRQRLGPAAAAMKRRYFYRDARESTTQIHVNDLISDAVAMHSFHSPTNTRQTRVLIHNEEELALYRQKRRAEWEEKVKRGYQFLGNWVKYATWEAAQGDYTRMRAICERASQISIHISNYVFWREYAELEASHGFVEHTRSVFARGVALLPGSVDLWVKYLALEMSAYHNNNNNHHDSQDTGKQRIVELLRQWRSNPAAPSCAYELSVLTEMQLASLRQSGQQHHHVFTTASSSSAFEENVVYSCRSVMREYVEKYNSVASWIFYYNVERHVFGNVARGIKVIQTALQALPEILLYGPSSKCTMPLLLIKSYVEANQILEARAVFQDILFKLEQYMSGNITTGQTINTEVEEVLQAYTQFEEQYGDKRTYKEVCNRAAEHLYKVRLSATPDDFDTYLALYVLLRDELHYLKRKIRYWHQHHKAHEKDIHAHREHNDDDNNTSDVDNVNQSNSLITHCITNNSDNERNEVENEMNAQKIELEHKLMSCLRDIVQVETQDLHKRAQRAVFVIELARQLEWADNTECNLHEAREVLAHEIKTFPFDMVECPRLWQEAAALEVRHGNIAQARKLLYAAAHVTHQTSMFDRLIELEQEEEQQKQQQQQEQEGESLVKQSKSKMNDKDGSAISSLRNAYQAAIKVFPQEQRYWFGLAKLEEHHGGVARAHVLLSACIQTIHAAAVLLFSSSSSTSLSASASIAQLTERYDLLNKVDLAWARRIALQRRIIRQVCNRLINNNTIDNNNNVKEDINRARNELHQIYYDLLRQVWSDYLIEALKWKQDYEVNVENEPKNVNAHDAVKANLTVNEQSSSQTIPEVLPEVLSLALTRWADAVDAIMTYILTENKRELNRKKSKKQKQKSMDTNEDDKHNDNLIDNNEELEQEKLQQTNTPSEQYDGLTFIRATFAELVRRERDVLHRTLAGAVGNEPTTHEQITGAHEHHSSISGNNSGSNVLELLGHDAAVYVQQWTQLLLSPLLEQWAKIETTYGGSVQPVQEEVQSAQTTQQTRRRTRLFKK